MSSFGHEHAPSVGDDALGDRRRLAVDLAPEEAQQPWRRRTFAGKAEQASYLALT
jgi:hypothetical protein